MIMKTAKMKITTIADVRDFVDRVRDYPGDIDLTSDRYVVDAKSIMGIFSLGLTQTIQITVHGDDDKAEAFLETIKEFLVDE